MADAARESYGQVPEGTRWRPNCNGYGPSLKRRASAARVAAGPRWSPSPTRTGRFERGERGRLGHQQYSSGRQGGRTRIMHPLRPPFYSPGPRRLFVVKARLPPAMTVLDSAHCGTVGADRRELRSHGKAGASSGPKRTTECRPERDRAEGRWGRPHPFDSGSGEARALGPLAHPRDSLDRRRP
jgi:hypothetical protein